MPIDKRNAMLYKVKGIEPMNRISAKGRTIPMLEVSVESDIYGLERFEMYATEDKDTVRDVIESIFEVRKLIGGE